MNIPTMAARLFVATVASTAWLAAQANWVDVSPSVSPPGRILGRMTTNLANGNIVLFGGYDRQLGTFFNDTWIWDGSNWILQSPATSPSPRSGHVMWFDLVQGRVMLFGGQITQVGIASDETWAWDGITWSLLPQTVKPPARFSMSLAYDLIQARAVMYGGRDFVSYLGDTWEWDGNVWIAMNPAQSPPPLAYAAMSYDVASNRSILFGGFPSASSAAFNHTYAWDGATWRLLNPVTRPPGRHSLSMTHDAQRQGLVVFGGWNAVPQTLGDTWLWSGDNWSQLQPATAPSSRAYTASAFDLATNETIIFGGEPDIHSLTLDTYSFGTATPATGVAFGTGCVGSNGTNELSQLTGAWIGSTYSAQAEGMPALSLALSVFGFSQVFLPLTTILPMAGANCNLLVTPDYIELRPTSNGSARTELVLPNASALIGSVVHHQVAALSVDAQFNLTELTSTNGLTVTVGAF